MIYIYKGKSLSSDWHEIWFSTYLRGVFEVLFECLRSSKGSPTWADEHRLWSIQMLR